MRCLQCGGSCGRPSAACGTQLAARYDEIREQDRRAVVAQMMALGVLGHAAGYAVHPCDRDIARDPNTIRGTGPFESA
jgi:hypothetical protein